MLQINEIKMNIQMFANPSIDLKSDGTTTFGSFKSESEAHEYFDKKFKDYVYDQRTLDKYSEPYKLPKNHGKTMAFGIWGKYNLNFNEIEEGVIPKEDEAPKRYEFRVGLSDFAGYTTYTDQADVYDLSTGIANRLVDMQAGALAEKLDERDYKGMLSSPNRWFAGVTYSESYDSLGEARAAVTTFQLEDFNKIRAVLKRMKVKPIDGYYHVLLSPEVVASLHTLKKSGTNENYTFLETIKNTNVAPILKGEIGTFNGFRFIEEEAVGVIPGTTNIHGCIILGKVNNELGYKHVNLEGENAPHVYIKPLGSSGTNDPVNQIGSVGWKIQGFGSVVQYTEAVMVYECKSELDVATRFDETKRQTFIAEYGLNANGARANENADVLINGHKITGYVATVIGSSKGSGSTYAATKTTLGKFLIGKNESATSINDIVGKTLYTDAACTTALSASLTADTKLYYKLD